MQLDEPDGYYNIDFERVVNINDFKDILAKNFPASNILVDSNDGCVEYFGNPNNDNFDVNISIRELKEDESYIFGDIKLRTLLYISEKHKITPKELLNILHNMSNIFDSKAYILMEDIERDFCSFSYCSVWCIDKDRRKIMFDAQEFFDSYQDQYCDYLPL